MRLPYRKPGKYMIQKPDPAMTKAKFEELQNKLRQLLLNRHPAAAEVARLAEFGDFSENVEYQLAKGRLRGINNKILEIENTLKNAEIIKLNHNNSTVQIGHAVTVEINNSPSNSAPNQLKTFSILGSAETDPNKNIISQNSPLGRALLGKKVGEKVKIGSKEKVKEYKIIEIK
ncbi:MAG TPA: GreA/GreB family elongation factor [Patescibacteria group bacterium]|nr:GreA/GreB family elongation factor [Patescibacteria group bacterium]